MHILIGAHSLTSPLNQKLLPHKKKFNFWESFISVLQKYYSIFGNALKMKGF